MLFLIAWLIFGFLAFIPPAFIFLFMRMKSKKAWPTKIDQTYNPKISIIIPTYNEEEIINYKLQNTIKLAYPTDKLEIIIVDSNSKDNTIKEAQYFLDQNKKFNIKIIVEKERKGKSHALNTALSYCKGEIIIVSDADCFWPKDILSKAIPCLADPTVGVIGGPKILFNANQSWITRMEQSYLKSANEMRLGESKAFSTLFFEGGFSAFKHEVLESFDPYETGSDDCGTVMNIIEKNFRAMLVIDAKFYSGFPATFKGKISIKLRRTIQLVQVFRRYLNMLIQGRANPANVTVVPNTLQYLFSPIAFIVFLFLTCYLIVQYPLLLAALALIAIPKVRFYSYQILENNILLFLSILAVTSGKRFSVWGQPNDRIWFTKEKLASYDLI